MKNPEVSIVILTKNGGQLLKDAIEMIFKQKTSFFFEVVVVDSGSKDGTLEYMKKHSINIFEIKPEEFKFGATRDFGFESSKGDFIVTISQDVIPADTNWMENLVQPIMKGEADIVQGSTWTPNDRQSFFWERNRLFYFDTIGDEFCKLNGNIGLSCTSLAIKRDVWNKIKFGNTPMSEDKLFQKRAFEKGCVFYDNKKAVAWHGHTYSLGSLIKRCLNEGLGWRFAGVKYSFRQMLRDLVQKRYIYGLLVRGIIKGEISGFAESLFLFIKPISLYWGNHYKKEHTA